jgi:hypothetical protein
MPSRARALLARLLNTQLPWFLLLIFGVFLVVFFASDLAVAVARSSLGDLATWVVGVAAAVIAWKAARIARDSQTTAERALEQQLREEASKVTWFVDRFTHDDPRYDLSYRTFSEHLDDGVYGHFPEGDRHVCWAVICILNRNDAAMVTDVSILFEGSEAITALSRGLKTIGDVRPGQSKVWVELRGEQSSALASTYAQDRLERNRYAEWIQFTDSQNRCWRRHRNGRLEVEPASGFELPIPEASVGADPSPS